MTWHQSRCRHCSHLNMFCRGMWRWEVGWLSPYFPILIACDPAAILPSKPFPVNDLQGRLCCCCWSTEELITLAVPGLCSKHMPVLGFAAREKRDRWRRRRRRRRRGGVLSLSWGLASFHSRLSWWPSCPTRFIPTLHCIACLLSHNDIVNGNNTSAYREVSADTMDEWQRNGKANLSCCHLQVFGGSLLLGRVCRRKIRLILHIAGLIAESCI